MFFLSETVAAVTTAVFIVVLLPFIGLPATGIAYIVCYIFYLALVYWLARRRIGLHWSRSILILSSVTFALCAAVGAIAFLTRWGPLVGCVVAVAFACYSLGRLTHMSNMGGPIGRLGAFARKIPLIGRS